MAITGIKRSRSTRSGPVVDWRSSINEDFRAFGARRKLGDIDCRR